MDTHTFKNTYRIKSIRLPEWNYRNVGYYFITLCTKERKEYFGKIENDEIVISDYWQDCKSISIGCFKTFPTDIVGYLCYHAKSYSLNHIHGGKKYKRFHRKFRRDTSYGTSPSHGTKINETPHGASLQTKNKQNKNIEPSNIRIKNTFGPQNTQSLGYIINQFKGSVTREVNKQIKKGTLLSYTSFDRQIRFYEHIIHNQKDHERIYEYIQNNPLQWDNDEYYIITHYFIL